MFSFHLVIAFLSLSSVTLAFDAQIAFQGYAYDPTDCHTSTSKDINGTTHNSFCIGIKDGAINFPEGTGCLLDYKTCDYIIIGLQYGRVNFLALIGQTSGDLDFYFSKTPGTAGRAHHSVVGVDNARHATAYFDNGTTEDTGNTSYVYAGLYPDEHGQLDNASSVFVMFDVIKYAPIGYEVDVKDPLYATAVIRTANGDPVYLHLPSPVKFFSGSRDGKPGTSTGGGTNTGGTNTGGTVTHDPKLCRSAQNQDQEGNTVNSFCIGVKDGQINFPEGTGCLKDFITCDYVVAGAQISKSNNTLMLFGNERSDLGFYFHKAPGIPKEFLLPVLGVGNAGQVFVYFKNGTQTDASGSTTLTHRPGPLPYQHSALFFLKDIISYPPIGYKVDVNDALYATLITGWGTKDQKIHHLSFPVKFYSGHRETGTNPGGTNTGGTNTGGTNTGGSNPGGTNTGGTNTGGTNPGSTNTGGTDTGGQPSDPKPKDKKDQEKSSGLGPGIIAAIVFGVGFAVILLVAIALYFCKTSKASSVPETPEIATNPIEPAAAPIEAVDTKPAQQNKTVDDQPVQQDSIENFEDQPKIIDEAAQNPDAPPTVATEPANQTETAESSDV